jgi:[ribosomal protein S18]-alanine N-acetyltransferase
LPIRPATAADISAIMALANLSSSAAQWPAEQYQQILGGSFPRRVMLVREEQSTVHAFLVGRVVDTEWEIENIVVDGSRRRQGLGKQLLDEFLRISKGEGARAIFLEVRESNLAARKLYEKCGFVENGRRQRYYKEPVEDAILYELLLA